MYKKQNTLFIRIPNLVYMEYSNYRIINCFILKTAVGGNTSLKIFCTQLEVKYENPTMLPTLFCCLYCWLSTDFTHCSGVSTVDFEQVNTGWVIANDFKLAVVPVNSYLFKANNGNTRKRREICTKLTMKTLNWRQWRCSGVFIDNCEKISHLAFLAFSLLTWDK